jgi:hypothetical protein
MRLSARSPICVARRAPKYEPIIEPARILTTTDMWDATTLRLMVLSRKIKEKTTVTTLTTRLTTTAGSVA